MNDHISVRFESRAFPEGAILVAEVKGQEAISKLFDFTILAVLSDAHGLDSDALAGADATLVFERGGAEIRRLSGMIASVDDQLDTETMHMTYRIRFVPRAFRLTLQETLDVYMDVTLPELIGKKLQAWGFVAGDDFAFRLYDQYPKREFIVQYKETDLAFLSRLTEHAGVSFFFEQRGDHEVMIFTDKNAGFTLVEGAETAIFRARGERRDVFHLETSTRLVPGQYVVRDYNYRTPGVDLIAAAGARTQLGGRIIEYGAHFKTQEEGDKLAKIRIEEQLASRRVYKGASDIATLIGGSRRKLLDHPWGDIDLVITEVTHTAKNPVLGLAASEGPSYANTFHALPLDQPYRPPRVTPKPRVNGVLTGVIDSASRGQYAELDDDGRYKVKFLFDTAERGEGQASRPVRMLQPHAGPGYGMHFPLRTGVEVALTFVEGDPDRPMIAGTAPNPQTASPVTAGNATRNIIRTGAGNEINIDDNEDGQRIKLSTPQSDTVFQLGYRNAPEDGAILTTSGAKTTVAASGMSAFGLFGATFSTIIDMLYSHVIVKTAAFPGVFDFINTGGKVLDGLLGITQAALDAALGQMTIEEKEKIEAAKDAIVKVDKAQKECKACREKGYAELKALLAAQAPNNITQAEYDTLKASLDEYNDASTASDAAYLSLIGVMEDRNGIILVNREGGNINFEKVMQNDCDNALAEYDLQAYITQKNAELATQWKQEWLAAEKLKNPSTTSTINDAPAMDAEWAARQKALWHDAAKAALTPDADKQTAFGAEYDALSAAEKAQYTSRQAYIDAKMTAWNNSPEKLGPTAYKANRENALLSQLGTKDSSGRWTASNTKYQALLNALTCDACTSLDTKRQDSINKNNAYANELKQAYGTEAQDLRRAKIGIDNARTGMAGINMIISAIIAVLGAVERFRAKAKMQARWTAGATVVTNSEPRAAVTGQNLTAHALTVGRPMHVIGSDSSTEVFGEDDVLVWAKTVMILGKGRKSSRGKVFIAGNKEVRITSPKVVELAGKEEVLISGKDVDIVGDDNVKLTAKHRPTVVGTGKLTALSDDEMELESETKDITLKAKAVGKKIFLDAEDKIKGDAKHVELTVTQTAEILAGHWYMKIQEDPNGFTKLGSDAWQLAIKTNEAKLGAQNSGFTATQTFSRVMFQNAVLKLDQARALLQSSGTVQLTGQTIKANGKVLLG